MRTGTPTRTTRRRIGIGAVLLTAVLPLLGPPVALPAAASPPSTACHVTDGTFTACDGGASEWGDVSPTAFPDRPAYLYADQADLVPDRGVPGLAVDTFMLLYDECGRTTPMGPDEYFLVSFDTVSDDPDQPEHIERYTVHIFTDGTIVFFEDGQIQSDDFGRTRAPSIDGQTGQAGFGRSPRCAVDHVVVEYQIELAAAGGHSYSPDPLFWGGTPSPQSPIAVDDDQDLADDASGTVNIVANDFDPDGTIVPSTVAVVDQPDRGTIAVAPSGVVTYTKGDTFEDSDSFSYTVNDNDGSTSNTATATVTGTCPSGRPIPVGLPPTTGTGTILSLLKGYSISYDPLALTFTTTSTPRAGAYCSADSTVGVLGVRLTCLGTGLNLCPDLFPRGVPILVATSTAVARLDFFRAGTAPAPPPCDFFPLGSSNNCLLNSGPAGGTLVRWQTDGFVIRDAFVGATLHQTDPLTFWVNLGGLISPSAPLAAKVNAAEVLIHTTLVNHLSAVDSLSIVQDPPAEILVTDPSGRRTGRTELGDLVTEIPGSVYSTSAAGASTAVMLLPAAGEYEVTVHGTSGEPFSLSMATIDLFGNVADPLITERTASGTIEPGGSTFSFAVPAGHRPPLPRSAIRPGFDAVALPANDDGSAGPVPLGFPANFFGATFDELYVNNNGNLTFGQPLSTFTPFDLSSANRSIIAPFFADVDTRQGAVARYGTGTVNGRPAFGATWPGVRCFLSGSSAPTAAPRDEFQVVLVDRGDLGAGNFDIEFNYDQIQWETGTASGGNSNCQGGFSARVGFANGSTEPGTSFELPGSGVPGAFLDTNPDTGLIHHSRDTFQRGRYFFTVRNGEPQTRDADHDSVLDDRDNCPHTGNPDQSDTDLDGIGEACSPPGRRHSTAGFLQAKLDGQTTAEAHGLALTAEPDLHDRLLRIVTFRVEAGLTTSAARLTANLVGGLVELGLVAPADAAGLIQSVLSGFNQPPSCAGLTVDQASLWPPNHKLVKVTVRGATDPDAGDAVTTVVDGVTQDEPLNAGGGPGGPDAVLTGPPSASVWIKAERDGNGNGRVYRVPVTVRDRAGLTCSGVVTVVVPHNVGSAAVDSAPPSYNSLLG